MVISADDFFGVLILQDFTMERWPWQGIFQFLLKYFSPTAHVLQNIGDCPMLGP